MTKDNLTERRVDEFLDKYMMMPATDKHGPTKHIVREILIRYDAQQQALLEECDVVLHAVIATWDKWYQHLPVESEDDEFGAFFKARSLLVRLRLRADHG